MVNTVLPKDQYVSMLKLTVHTNATTTAVGTTIESQKMQTCDTQIYLLQST